MSAWDEHQRGKLCADIRSGITKLFRNIRETYIVTYPLYSCLGKLAANEDVVITFNYDTAVESALIQSDKFRVSDGYGFDTKYEECESSPVKVLKPHGSVNWVALVQMHLVPQSSVFETPLIDNKYLDLRVYPPELLDSRFRCGTLHPTPSHVLPSRHKRFCIPTDCGNEWRTFYDRLWIKVVQALSDAARVVIIGYSMPDADERACKAILSNANREAETVVCCHGSNAAIAARLRQAGHNRLAELPRSPSG